MINQELNAIKYRSFYLNGNLEAMYISFYIKFEFWYEVVIADGNSSINIIDESKLSNIGKKENAFFYPIYNFNKIDFAELGNLLKVQEYLMKSNTDESFGYLFSFENKSLSIIEDKNEVLDIIETPDNFTCKDFILREVSYSFCS